MPDPKQLKRVKEWRTSDILFSLVHIPDSGKVVVGSSDFKISEVDFSQEKLDRLAFEGDGHSSYVTGLALAGETVVSASYDGKLIFWELETRQQQQVLPAHDSWIRRIVVSPDGARIFSVADDMQCKVWDVAQCKHIATFSDHQPLTPHHYPSMLYALAVSEDGTRLATGDRVGHIAVWDTATFEKVAELEAPVMYTWDPKQRRHSIGGIRSLAFSPDGSKLAVGGIGKIGNIDHLAGPARLEIFDLNSGERLHELEDNKHKGLIEQIIWSPDGSFVLTAGGDHKGFITCYDAVSGKLLHQDSNGGHIHGCAVDTAFEQLFVAAHQRVELWELSERSNS